MQSISPKKIRFIKLGFGGVWEQSCIADGTIRLGYESPHHQESLDGNWDEVRKFWLQARNGDEGATTRDINQIRDFYELGVDDLWITFYKRSLFWCRTEKEVTELPDGSRIRRVIGRWSSTDIKGKPLRVENIDGRVTTVQAFRGTICDVKMPDYLVRKINGQSIPEVEQAKSSLNRLQVDVGELIKGLGWKDFELLVDLVFSKAGWQRFSVLGSTQKDIDLDVYSPATQKRAFVQIKSSTSRSEIEAYISIYKELEQFDEMYFVFHTCSSDLSDLEAVHASVRIWDLPRVSSLVVSSGLVEWLINKRS